MWKLLLLAPWGWAQGFFWGAQSGSCPYFVTLKILSRRRALRTLMPKEVPGFTAAQITSKMLPTMTCGERALQRGHSCCSAPCAASREAQKSEFRLFVTKSSWKMENFIPTFSIARGRTPCDLYTERSLLLSSLSNQNTLKYPF